MFSVYVCTRYQSVPKESHLKSVKWTLRYLHGTSKYGLWYSKGSDYNLVGYTNSGRLSILHWGNLGKNQGLWQVTASGQA